MAAAADPAVLRRALARGIVAGRKRQLPSLAGGGIQEPAKERLPGRPLSIQKQAQLRGAPAPARKEARA
eukprot:12891865-Alexandrium_andersonii.AAC.1